MGRGCLGPACQGAPGNDDDLGEGLKVGWIQDSRSLGDLFKRNCGKYGDKVAYRVPSKAGYRDVSYSAALEDVYRYARALDSFGLSRGDTIALVCETCYEWAVTDWAAQTLGIVLVPIYPTLPADQAQYIADDCGAKLVVAQDAKQAEKFRGVPTVLLKDQEGLLARDSGLTRQDWDDKTASVQPGDLATIIYTSGTTGQPKGAMLTHQGFIDLSQSIHDTYEIDERDTFLSFLPLSHVFERYAGHVLPIAVGATIAYAGSLASLASDLEAVGPTIMCSVPRFFENLRSRVLEGVAKQPPLRQRVFHLGLKQGASRAKGGFAPLFWLTDKLVGAKIRAKTGGRIRFFVSGGAALAPAVSEFYIACGLNILQGYGLTETTAATCLNLPEDNKPWTVGPPIPCVDIKIAPDGEILIRGTAVMKGYYNLPDATAEAIDGEGWFHTGDIGEFEGKNLKITDRKKDIIVLANGKNVAPQKIEGRLKEGSFIAEAVVFGDGMEHLVGLIVPDFDRLRSHLGKKDASLEDLAQCPDAKALIKAEVDQANKGMADFERVKKHAVLVTAFSVESGELTPSLKVKRKVVRERFQDALKTLGA